MKNSLIYQNDTPIKHDDVKFITVNRFDEDALNKFYEKFLELDLRPEIKVIPIVINSYGGNVSALLGMLDIMKLTNKPVATIALGKAMSCGAVLLSAGTKGYRYAGAHTSILIHEVSSSAGGKTADLENELKDVKNLNNKLMRLLAKNCGLKNKDYFLTKSRKNANVDLYYSAEESRKLGLIDFVSVPRFLKG